MPSQFQEHKRGERRNGTAEIDPSPGLSLPKLLAPKAPQRTVFRDPSQSSPQKRWRSIVSTSQYSDAQWVVGRDDDGQTEAGGEEGETVYDSWMRAVQGLFYSDERYCTSLYCQYCIALCVSGVAHHCAAHHCAAHHCTVLPLFWHSCTARSCTTTDLTSQHSAYTTIV